MDTGAMTRPDLRRLFSACDLNRSGLIEFEDFSSVCRELGVSRPQVAPLFHTLDVDSDGSISFNDFAAGFEEVSAVLDLSSFGSDGSQAQKLAWEEFEDRFGAGLRDLRSREKLFDFYQHIRAVPDYDLNHQYEKLIHELIKDSKVQSMETGKLEQTLKRTEEMADVRLAEMEEDMQQQATKLEQKIRGEEQSKLEAKMAEMQKRHETEVTDLQAVIDRMKKLNEELWNSNSKGDISALKEQLDELTQENEHLRSSLLQSQTATSILEAGLDKCKNELADHQLDQERTKEIMKKLNEENEVSMNQIQMLQEANKALYDSNNGLRTALERNHSSNKNKYSLNGLVPERGVKSEVQNGIPSYNRQRISEVANWADRYLDGVSTSQGVDYSSDDYDSEESNDSRETMHYSYSYVASDTEMPELRLEVDGVPWSRKPSRPVSRCSSTASSRRRLPAFSSKNVSIAGDNTQSDGPLYRLVLAGDAGSGKSSFLLRLCMNEFKGHIPTTLGVDFQMKKLLVDGESATLQIWDTAGQERFRSIAKSYFRKAHGVLLLYDVTSENSFLNVREWIDEIKSSTDIPTPIILIGNKIDLRNETPYAQRGTVLTAHGEKLAMTYNALFCETSAKDGTNVVEAVLHLAREAKKHAKIRDRVEPIMKLIAADGKKALNCCKA
ncbi:ras and EF-hand domain-containing protein isoform X1 [Carcharodon carcharias]|uniref:ras and EF-hand domain-containing protein isoform X1 n=2 Tax=Carcharodon carcharias TaxID=13397 RepID=UPI001B7F55DA|nr:ras and EF-hand domain-containing protein isoform X1 [Carcharodon carcharias]